MKICDLCNLNVSKLTDIFLNNKKEFVETDVCDRCFEQLKPNNIKIWFQYYPFYKLLNDDIAKIMLKERIACGYMFPAIFNKSYDYEEKLDKAKEEITKAYRKIKITDILKMKKGLEIDLSEVIYETEVIKDYGIYGTIKLSCDDKIWKPWRYDTQRFALDEYIVRYDFKTYIYQNEDAEMIEKHIYKELSTLRLQFIKLVDYIEYNKLEEYTKTFTLQTKRSEEIKKIDNEHKRLYDLTMKNILQRRWSND